MEDNFFSDVWKRRSLITLLAFNDVKLRYKNSALGFLWSFLEPLLMLAVLYFVFSTILKSDIQDYPLYLLIGLIIWYVFSRSSTLGLSSLLDKAGIIQKIYFRRELIVISSCLTAFIMMGFEFAAFAVFVFAFQFIPPITILLLPLLLIDLFILSLGVALLLAVLTVYFRDIKFIWQVLLQAGFFLTPIFYRLDMFPEDIAKILQINPIVPIMDTAHDLVLYNSLPSINTTLYIIISTCVIFVIGYIVFRIKDKKIIEEL
ncbi:MAG TPA: ABC transporter permease [Nitrosopumilaceae archaeon]|nr:ABC transporter permease [Nitrosopumilaceae archaeon]